MADSNLPPVATLTIPVTVLAGSESPLWMREAAQTLAQALTKAFT